MAIITAAQARLMIPQLTGTAEDTDIDTMIARADAVFGRWLGYPRASTSTQSTVESTTYTHYLHGPMTTNKRAIMLPVRPVVSVTSVHDDTNLDYGSSFLVASGDYTIDTERGIVELNPDSTHGGWSRARRAIMVRYRAGYSTLPTDMQQACAFMVAHWWRMRRQAGYSNINQAGGSVAVLPATIPAEVRQMLEPYRLAGSVFG